MSFNSMQVIMCRILAELYYAMKHGVTITDGLVGAKALEVEPSYWSAIMQELVDQGFVVGVKPFHDMNGQVIDLNLDNARITLSGVEFLENNSGMRRAIRYLKEMGSVAPAITSLFPLA